MARTKRAAHWRAAISREWGDEAADSREQHARDTDSRKWRKQMGTVTTMGQATRGGFVLWLASRRWRRCVDAALASTKLSFTQWLVLGATACLTEEIADCVSQNQVAARLDLDRMSVSSAMTALDRRSLVSRGGAMSGTAWRVFVTEKGVELLNTCTENVEAALAAA